MTTQTTDNIIPIARGFASGYVGRGSGRDEMVEADGSLRPHWRMFVNLLDDLGP
ncbi:MAG: hypothetical protein JWL69_1214, partial [Phycisphaerales bacterium]|nr:hypothetical protein [Phycisphaerales bacterium]